MSEPVEIKIRDNGSIKITGEVRVVDEDGNILRESEGRPLALCRCGHSESKPFCDGAHRRAGFESTVRA